MMLDKKKIERFSYLSSKWVVKQWRQLARSTPHLAQELLTNVYCIGGSRSFAKETKVLKVRRGTVPSHGKLTTTIESDHQNWSSYNYRRICWGTQCWPFCGHLAFEANWKQKRLISGCLMSWLKQTNKQTNIILKCHLLLFYTTTRHFSTGLWYETKNGFYTKTGNDQLSGWTEKKLQNTSQSQTCTKKRSWSLFGGLLPVWHTTAFWILVKPLHLRSVLSKSMRCTKNCNAYNQHWSTERAQFFSMTKVQPHVTQPMLQKLKELGYKVLTHLPYSSVLSPTDNHLFKHLNNFLEGKCF